MGKTAWEVLREQLEENLLEQKRQNIREINEEVSSWMQWRRLKTLKC